MKYAFVAAALAGLAMAIPTNEWENVKDDKKCPAVTKTYTTKECGKKENDGKPGYGWNEWENCKDVTKTSTEYPKECPTKTPGWCKGGKDKDGKECHSDDDDWSNWPKGCKWGKDKDGKDCKGDDDKKDKDGKDKDGKDKDHKDDKNEWENVPKKPEDGKKDDKKEWENVKDDKKCYTTKVYTTKECGNDKDKWDNCKDVTKTKTEYASTCTEWAAVTTTPAWNTWTDKCAATTKTYTTKECGKKENDGKPGYGWNEWENCKDVTKTKTEYPAECTVTKKVEETWKVWTSEPAKTPAAQTSSAEWNTWKASSTVAAPVAKWTGAADKQSVGFGALAIAAVAALL